LKNNAPFN